ncbi:MAG: transporter substrate-binding domain-containing protein [Bacteroidota bacterium]|nr:transporter substrate-binding domain-containing protein [Bacteroidota bacterium]
MSKHILSLALFLSILNFAGLAQNPDSRKLVIGLKEAPPFVIQQNGQYSGVCLDLWTEIADELGFEYTFKIYNLEGLLKAIEEQEVDLSINPLTVTADRIERFNFSQPFYVTNLGIATRYKNDSTIIAFISKLASVDFIKAVFLLMMIVFVFGLVVWLVERRFNKEQFSKGVKGLGDGIWWSAVTMTTVGYGDKAPVSAWGRIISVVWMFTAVIVISSFTAGIASSLTITQMETSIKGIDDLRKARVGTISNSASASFLKDYGIVFIGYDDISKGLEDVNAGQINAFVYDEAILRYLIHDSKLNEHIIIIPSSYSKEYFSFASAKQELINKINPVLIRNIESTNWKDILEKYNLEYQK